MGCCGKIVHGATALVKVAAGVGLADDATVANRRNACRACRKATRNTDARFAANAGLTTFSRCRACGCFIAAKTKLAGERCPDGQW